MLQEEHFSAVIAATVGVEVFGATWGDTGQAWDADAVGANFTVSFAVSGNVSEVLATATAFSPFLGGSVDSAD